MANRDRVGTLGVAPILISHENVVAATGLTWREALALAERAGVRVARLGPRQVISARQLVAAIEAEPTLTHEASEPESAEEVVLARLGRRAGGGR